MFVPFAMQVLSLRMSGFRTLAASGDDGFRAVGRHARAFLAEEQDIIRYEG
jgi:hypothetical protein